MTTINYEGGVTITTSSNNDITFSPNGSGDVNLGGNFTLPTADGSMGQVLETNGSGVVSFATIVQATGSELESVLDDGSPQLGADLDVNGSSIISASDGNIEIFPNGTGAVDISTQELVHDAGDFSGAGDARTGQYVLREQTTNADVTEMFIDGSSVRLALADDTTWGFNIMVIGRRTDVDDEGAVYKFEGAIDRNSGVATTALIGAGGTKTVIDEDTAAWDTAISADTTNGSLKIEVTGEAAKSINWVAFVRTVETTG